MTLSVVVQHRFNAATIDISFEVPTPGITVLFGPSGAGKSTILAAAAGLMRPHMCRIAIGSRILSDTGAGIWLPAERRRIGVVFQDSRLFPHMSVATNLRFGARRAPPGPVCFHDIVELLDIGAILNRRPHTLSGGERQRVAIGRALLTQPDLLLMDEPLASLDGPRKDEIMPFLLRLKTALRLPVLYVTHAITELNTLADSLVLLNNGRVLAYGPVSTVASRADLPLAHRDDAGALLSCQVAGHDQRRALTRLDAAGTTFLVPLIDAAIGQSFRIRIPAREVILASLVPEAISLHNVVPCTIRQIVADAFRQSVLVELDLSEGALLSRVTKDAVTRLGLVPQKPVLALIKSTSIEMLTG